MIGKYFCQFCFVSQQAFKVSSGTAANAASVGAKTVKGPSELRVSTRSFAQPLQGY
jgi:hypothetical protein